MTVPDLERRLAELLRATGADHHAAFAAADGDDPEWPLWYAQHMHERAAALLGAPITVSDLVHWLVQSERDRAASSPDAAWPEYYAAALARLMAVEMGKPGVKDWIAQTLGPVIGKDKLPVVLNALGPNWAIWAEPPVKDAFLPTLVAAVEISGTPEERAKADGAYPPRSPKARS